MELEKRVEELEKKVAALEVQAQEQPESNQTILIKGPNCNTDDVVKKYRQMRNVCGRAIVV